MITLTNVILVMLLSKFGIQKVYHLKYLQLSMTRNDLK